MRHRTRSGNNINLSRPRHQKEDVKKFDELIRRSREMQKMQKRNRGTSIFRKVL